MRIVAKSQGAFFTLALLFAVLDVARAEKKEGPGKVKPIVTTDIFYDTAELLSDIYGEAWGKLSSLAAPHVAPFVTTVLTKLPKDPLAEICAKVGLKKSLVLEKYATAQNALLHAKSLTAAAIAKAEEPLNSLVVKAVNMFEKIMPKYAGLIPKTIGDFLLFTIYLLVVLYIVLRVFLWMVRKAFSIFCCICCCGCCGRRQGNAKPASNKPSKGNAVKKGEAAAAPKAKVKAKKGA